MNFQMFKLDLEKVEEPETKLPTYVESLKKQESSRKTSTSALLTRPKPMIVDHSKLLKILKDMGIPDHLICPLRNLYAGHGTTGWLQIRKRIHQGYILPPCLFNLYEEYLMPNARLDEARARIKIARRNINNLRYAVMLPYGRK